MIRAIMISVVLSLPPALVVADVPQALLEPDLPLAEVPVMEARGFDLAEVKALEQKEALEGYPPRFAVQQRLIAAPDSDGRWDTGRDGKRVWRLRVRSAGALSLNLTFSRFFMPPGAEVYLYDPNLVTIRGPFDDRHNRASREFWSPVLLSDEVVIELNVSPEMERFVELELASVNHGYTGFGYPQASDGDRSGACNVDVVCPEGDNWRSEIRSVGVYTRNGSWTCTGALVNNTLQDLTPYFLTANHCGVTSSNDDTVVIYWNFENSTCRPPGSPASGGAGDGSLDEFTTGTHFRAAYSASDMTLIEISEDPPSSFDVHWAGWDNTSVDPPSCVAIHHPNTDEKRISFEDDPLQTTTYLGTSSPGDGTHLRVVDWDLGTTEPGSSGSPIFNPDRRIIGQLHGGYAACGNDESDWYGRVSVSWDGGGSDSTRLSAWLDPNNSGATVLDGRDQCVPPDVTVTIDPNPATANEIVSFSASVVGGTPPYSYEWDLDADGVTDCTEASCQFTYTAYFADNIALTVTDDQPCSRVVSEAMVVDAPLVQLSTVGDPVELCGDGDTVIEPGEEWQVPISVENVGSLIADATAATVAVAGDPADVTLLTPALDFAEVGVVETATANLEFYIDSGFGPCGDTIEFDVTGISWTGGSAAGENAVFTAATGGGVGTQDAFAEDFEVAKAWSDWTVTTGPGPHTAGEWVRTDTGVGGNDSMPEGGSGYWAVADSDTAGSGSTTSTILTSPVIDLSWVHFGPVTVDCDLYYHDYIDDEYGAIEVFDGADWHEVARYEGSDINAHQSVDVTSYAIDNPDFQVRFSYQDASFSWWFAVDNVRVVVPVDPVCDNTVVCGVPTAAFSVSPLVCAGSDVTMTNLSQNADTYEWDLDGDGFTDSTDVEPTWSWATPGDVTCTLTAFNTAGQTEVSAVVHVIDPTSAISCDASGDGLVDAADLAAGIAELSDGDGTAVADRCQGFATTNQIDAVVDGVIDGDDLAAIAAAPF